MESISQARSLVHIYKPIVRFDGTGGGSQGEFIEFRAIYMETNCYNIASWYTPDPVPIY